MHPNNEKKNTINNKHSVLSNSDYYLYRRLFRKNEELIKEQNKLREVKSNFYLTQQFLIYDMIILSTK